MTLFTADFINSIEAVANIFYLIEQNVDEPEAVRELSEWRNRPGRGLLTKS